jgi:prolyl 4-hydroxylase
MRLRVGEAPNQTLQPTAAATSVPRDMRVSGAAAAELGRSAAAGRGWEVVMTKDDLDRDRVFVIHEFLSGEECSALIRRSESLAYETGTVGDAVVERVRNNERVLLDDPTLAAHLFLRAKPYLPGVVDGRVLVGFNERWRFYRYRSGQTFKPHRDGSYERLEVCEESHLTFMIYLNDQVTGGETRFFEGMEQAFRRHPYLSIKPREGMALVFVHRIWHEGAVVESGQKYVLRTDVMYGRPPKLDLAEPSR